MPRNNAGKPTELEQQSENH